MSSPVHLCTAGGFLSHFDNFDHSVSSAPGTAFDRTVRQLEAAGSIGAGEREAIASQLIALARQGVHDVEALIESVMNWLRTKSHDPRW